jgi:hypothetical protein
VAIVRADAMCRHQFADGTCALPRGVRTGDTPDRPAADEMHETEIRQRRDGVSGGSLNGVARGGDGCCCQFSGGRKDPVHVFRWWTVIESK